MSSSAPPGGPPRAQLQILRVFGCLAAPECGRRHALCRLVPGSPGPPGSGIPAPFAHGTNPPRFGGRRLGETNPPCPLGTTLVHDVPSIVMCTRRRRVAASARAPACVMSSTPGAAQKLLGQRKNARNEAIYTAQRLPSRRHHRRTRAQHKKIGQAGSLAKAGLATGDLGGPAGRPPRYTTTTDHVGRGAR